MRGVGMIGERWISSGAWAASRRTTARPLPVLDPDARGGVRLERCDLHRATISRYAELVAILGDMKGRLDEMNEISEMTSRRLQMLMDRRAKFLQTLSNIMKKISSTQDALVQN